jgi:hypothetical protein
VPLPPVWKAVATLFANDQEEQVMKKLNSCLLALGLVSLPFTVAAELDQKKPFLCASNEVMECLPADGCKRVSADAVDAPRFIKVDTKNKKLATTSGSGERSSNIERVEEVDEKLILQGAEDDRKEERDGFGWTMTVAKDSGDMVVTAAGDGVAFVIFGACTAL